LRRRGRRLAVPCRERHAIGVLEHALFLCFYGHLSVQCCAVPHGADQM
jgi:hypothetical protein